MFIYLSIFLFLICIKNNKKKKKTEWFYITEPEILDVRIEKLVRNLPGVEEVDIEVLKRLGFVELIG